MSEIAEVKETKTVCNLCAMLGAFMELSNIQAALFEAYKQAAALEADFEKSYEGEAKIEVMTFLEYLPLHIFKLALFYGKMAQYVTVTSMSFESNDQAMADKLGE